jgi:hypothetical protein
MARVITVAPPCSEAWEQLRGNDQIRFCQRCEKHVHNLSAMTEDQVEALFRTGPDLCIRAVVNDDGTRVTLPCAAPSAAPTPSLRWWGLGLGAGLAAGAALALPDSAQVHVRRALLALGLERAPAPLPVPPAPPAPSPRREILGFAGHEH